MGSPRESPVRQHYGGQLGSSGETSFVALKGSSNEEEGEEEEEPEEPEEAPAAAKKEPAAAAAKSEEAKSETETEKEIESSETEPKGGPTEGPHGGPKEGPQGGPQGGPEGGPPKGAPEEERPQNAPTLIMLPELEPDACENVKDPVACMQKPGCFQDFIYGVCFFNCTAVETPEECNKHAFCRFETQVPQNACVNEVCCC
ncbi:Rhoptry neck protein 1, related [Eimeria tenella]|uniref:Rhoptry neck protein 1, related n=1 Tax=Eimeria tenella TaxID=5802 RepID=U6L1E6_EIMTE|nr:Rhoptry neck protein 1, related [Eimeria tenella]CDJ44237.1 Rhoptry neck protein 1, related [Eimeria tenella]|eukprot:XP_013234986.1 Rhoptry neck protein 1, related [Eimeria tenella]